MNNTKVPMKIALALIFMLSACSLFSTSDIDKQQSESSPPDELSQASSATARPIARRKDIGTLPTKNLSQPAIEIIWQATDATIERYIINFGYNELVLNNKLELSVENIDQYEDPVHGSVYRYLLLGSDSAQDLFFNIQAARGEVLSETSPTMRVAADLSTDTLK